MVNLNSLKEVERKNEIVGLFWDDSEQTKVCVGRRNKQLDFYDMKEERWYKTLELGKGGGAALKCITAAEQHIVTADADGLVQLWDGDNPQLSVQSGDSLCCMGQKSDEPYVIATGGKESDAKVWDLHNPQTPVFSAKNVRNDWLDLRVPVWVRGIAFVPQSDKLVTCTTHHQVRMYDPSSRQRRPVIDVQHGDLPLVAMAMVPSGHQVVVGNSNGDMALIDLRKAGLVHGYKGSAGGIRCIQCHSHKPMVASCGLDRFLRVYDLQSQALLHKVYLKSRLNCLLYRDEPFESKRCHDEPSEEVPDVIADEMVDEMAGTVSDEEDDTLWRSLDEGTSREKKRPVKETKRLRSSRLKRKKSSVGQ